MRTARAGLAYASRVLAPRSGRRRLAALGVAAIAALPLAGCAEQDKAQAGAALEAYLNDYATGNVVAACARLTPQARLAFRTRIRGVLYQPCAPAMRERLRISGASWIPRLMGLQVTSVDVHGDRASAVTAPDSLLGGAPTPLRKIGGRWLITAPADLKLVPTPPSDGF